MVADLLVYASAILTVVLLLWKVLAATLGLSYRRKWVWKVDVAALSAIFAMDTALHIAWRRLYRPGTERVFLIEVAALAAVFALCVLGAHVTERFRRKRRETQEAWTQKGTEGGGIS